ncbi:MAG TPA: DnaJ domain-containing protein [Spirochaetia bacterium]|nr:DnaJ domain-containing protein [Spirochaetia bacterium]
MTATETLIQNLQESAVEHGTWSVHSDDLSDRYDSVDYYRAVYETAQVSVDSYGPDNVGELLVLIERLTGRDYRPQFREAGLFLSHDDRIELTDRFIRIVQHAVVVHVPEPETFRAMLREFKRYDRAEFVYLDHFFGIDALVSRCADAYLELREAPALRSTVESYLRLLVQRHIVDLHDLAAGLLEILRTVARHEGFLRGSWREDESAGQDDASTGHQTNERRSRAGQIATTEDALRVLEIRTSRPTAHEIRESYRRLMRRYHPDINPAGLERAKIINNAYGLLIARFENCH